MVPVSSTQAQNETVPSWRRSACQRLGKAARHLPPFKGKCRGGRYISKWLLGNTLDGRILIVKRDGAQFSLDPRSRTEAGLFFDGIWEEGDAEFFECCLPRDGVALDIGANIGLVAVPLARYTLGRGRIVAFEPVDENMRVLRQNIALNGLEHSVDAHHCALGDYNGTIRIARETAMNAGTNNAYTEKSASALTIPLHWSTVPIRRLDDVMAEAPVDRIDFIKMDVEGAELDVLRGARQVLETFRPIIYGEFQLTLRPASDGTFADVAHILNGLDYVPFAFTGRLQLVSVPYEAGRGNVVLCPREQIGRLLARCESKRASRMRPPLGTDG